MSTIARNPQSSTTNDLERNSLLSLDAQRKSLESEAEGIVSELLSPPESGGAPMGIDTPLVDDEGYPRADIDVYRARVLRRRLNEIRTDRKDIMKKLETGIHLLARSKDPSENDGDELNARLTPKPKPKFDAQTGKWVVKNWDGTVAGIENGHARSFDNLHRSPTPDDDDATPNAVPIGTSSDDNITTTLSSSVPFAIVDAVSPDSPAEVAGLHEGDFITSFGRVDHSNHDELRAIASLVPLAAATGEEVVVRVLRRRRMSVEHDVMHEVEAGVRVGVEVRLRPMAWGGRGLLGCHIVLYDEITAARYVEPSE
mmetsp:Transcript_44912/g.54412  ORF Transcript_44912/g.54412 Transcript_44912/m.54412 type:complete len:313 (-) Transcript_44912:279-1217(-)|eukprot:CAMPEP_0172509638 /NCGR_PEP_ID=MMETSP1066-20121228/221850_1 /TAXON_ID=671091 /ORGANISM="Coscinodiscus wailesii, Strain CCMP2513" /LENGTH=312 /DNA_ID=CAMNT_0013288225 /DNA_START=163 /DNA_END=1101 /DNA_ORIENTATION=-